MKKGGSSLSNKILHYNLSIEFLKKESWIMAYASTEIYFGLTFRLTSQSL